MRARICMFEANTVDKDVPFFGPEDCLLSVNNT